jgi:hypothetical protein
MEVDQVDHGESWLLLKRYQANFRAKGSFTPKLGGMCWHRFLEKQVKKGLRETANRPIEGRTE